MAITRRRFLGRSAIAAIGVGFGSPLLRGGGVCRARGLAAAGPAARRTIVVVNLDGGNDGLNTVVPLFEYDIYRKRRRTLAIDRERVLSLPDAPELGFNPHLAALRELYVAGRVAVVNGFGPPPDAVGLFDHRRSQLLIQTADVVRPDAATGWIGRWLDLAGEGAFTPAVNLGFGDKLLTGDQGLVASGARRNALAVRSLDDIGVRIDADPAALESYGRIMGLAPRAEAAAERNRKLRRQLLDEAAIVRERAGAYVPAVTYPGEVESPLAHSLGMCARLIGADLDVKALAVGYTGFDTHAGQNDADDVNGPGFHDFLLQSVSDAIGLFYTDLEAHGLADRVVTLVMSEFGRRANENAKRGTDHGFGSVAFVVGGAVRGGVYGEHPSLADDRLVQGNNLDVTTDFRSVYATILGRFFGQDPAPVLGFDAPLLEFL
jgi:uncharacterized protein (DUF1501 family)